MAGLGFSQASSSLAPWQKGWKPQGAQPNMMTMKNMPMASQGAYINPDGTSRDPTPGEPDMHGQAPMPTTDMGPDHTPQAAWMGNYLKDLQGKINQPRTQPQPLPYGGNPIAYGNGTEWKPQGIAGPVRSALPAPIPHYGPNASPTTPINGVPYPSSVSGGGMLANLDPRKFMQSSASGNPSNAIPNMGQTYMAPVPGGGTMQAWNGNTMQSSGVEVDAGGNPNGPGPHGQGPNPNTLPTGDDPNNFFSQGNVNRSLRNLGFGEAPRPFDPAQGGFSDFDAMERSAYQSQFAPVQREIERQRVRGTEQMRARLAQTGLSDSGVGLAQENMQNQDIDERLASASAEAANRAANLRYGADLQQSMGNAQLRQANNQLTVEQQQRAQTSFLSLMGLNEQDLARIDQQQLENLRLMYDTYLKQLAIIGQIGTASFGKGDQSSSGFGFGASGFI